MSKYLVVLIWPVGLALVACGAFLAARRPALPGPGHAAGLLNMIGPDGGRHHGRATAGRPAFRGAAGLSARMLVISGAGAALVFGVMCLLGLVVVNHGLTIDRPVFTWITGHKVHAASAAMNRLTKIGDTWTTWGAAGAAAACLAATWRDKRWLPPVALAWLIVVDHYTTLALRHVFHRLGPPTSPLGTYPSGGCDRSIVFYGLIAYLIWREFSGRRVTAIWAAAAVAALGFNEAYSRVYLSLHWLTDALSGLIYGALLLGVFIVAVRAVAGPAGGPRGSQVAAAQRSVLPHAEGSVA